MVVTKEEKFRLLWHPKGSPGINESTYTSVVGVHDHEVPNVPTQIYISRDLKWCLVKFCSRYHMS